MAPWAWMVFFVASMAASAVASLAWDTSTSCPGCCSATAYAARYSGPLANSICTATLAIKCLTAWNEPTGLPNCLRSKV
ncbi:hypothetical protein D3C86_1715970 [compost metagenome]